MSERSSSMQNQLESIRTWAKEKISGGAEPPPKSAEDLLYSFEAIDHLDDETKRLYRIWLNQAVSLATREGRFEVTVDDVRRAASDALEEFLGAERRA